MAEARHRAPDVLHRSDERSRGERALLAALPPGAPFRRRAQVPPSPDMFPFWGDAKMGNLRRLRHLRRSSRMAFEPVTSAAFQTQAKNLDPTRCERSACA